MHADLGCCMEWYLSLFLQIFHQLVFPCMHKCVERHTVPSLLVFVENTFTTLYVYYGGGCNYVHGGDTFNDYCWPWPDASCIVMVETYPSCGLPSLCVIHMLLQQRLVVQTLVRICTNCANQIC